MRAAARKPLNYWLRVGAASATMLLLYAITENANEPPADVGTKLFASVNCLLSVLMLTAVPLMTADSIAREKREGTLGLLFLTPLSSRGIVIGKSLVQGLRALTLWLSALPVLAIPFLLGGVTWIDLLSAILLQLMLAAAGLAAGLIATSLTRHRNTAFLIAMFLAFLFILCLATQFILLFLTKVPSLASLDFGWIRMLATGLSLIFFLPGIMSWSRMLSMIGPSAGTWFSILCQCLAASLMLLFLALRFAAWRIARSWQDKEPSLRVKWWEKRFCTELFKNRFKRNMSRTLDFNPIAWLQQYSWLARFSKWGLCLALVGIEATILVVIGTDHFDSLLEAEKYLLVAFAATFIFVGVSGFLMEKQSGALELILITPLSVNQIIWGRAWGLWMQFLPSLLAIAFFHLLGLWTHTGYLSRSMTDSDSLIYGWAVLCVFLSLPFFATYAALRIKNLLIAGILTCTGLALVFAFAWSMEIFLGAHISLAISTAGLVGLTFFLLRHSLSRRIYPF